jgi:sigma-B regulation protein RsbU (phosphoserine phosphatase)
MFDGIFGGRNSGRACWVVAGTFCKGEVQGTFAQKFSNCAKCEFFHRVRDEEGPSFLPVNVLLNYIDRTHEQRVVERTHELREATAALEEANGKLAAANGKLEAANEELARANCRASLDMAMAARLQASFFPKAPPESGAWDVSFVFSPVAGVSGDLYDFYSRNGELHGVSLFDVSGHGIAPGLLTLLARSVIHNEFSAGSELRLAQVIERANRTLVRELDAIDNYLTGVILRFSHNRVEYVNAGHPDVLVRRASSGEVLKVARRDREFKGQFLGIAALEGKFTTVVFNMMKNDIIVLYTDGLVETRNAAGEEYGVERLERSLSSVDPSAGAREITGRLTADFQAFIDPRNLKDDLTLVAVRRSGDANWSPDYAI